MNKLTLGRMFRKTALAHALIALVLLFTCSFAAFADPGDTTYVDSLAMKKLLTNPTSLLKPDPKTIGVARYCNHTDKKKDPMEFLVPDNVVYPADYILVKTDSNGVNMAKTDLDTFRLWINGICYHNLKPLYLDETNSALVFRLSVDTLHSTPWQLFYAWPNYWTFHQKVTIQLGTIQHVFHPELKPPIIALHTTSWWMLLIGYALFIALLFCIFRFGKGIGRDVGLYAINGVKITYKSDEPTSDTAGTINVTDIPFSLARIQFLFWLVIIFFGIIHIWAIRDILTNPTGTVLLLLGISGGTFYIGKMIDKKGAGDDRSPQDTVKDFIANSKSKDFFYDILNDGSSISLHRLQLVMFTAFLGIYFILETLYGLYLPQFSDTMMTLMGISSVTYAGMKTTE